MTILPLQPLRDELVHSTVVFERLQHENSPSRPRLYSDNIVHFRINASTMRLFEILDTNALPHASATVQSHVAFHVEVFRNLDQHGSTRFENVELLGLRSESQRIDQ